MLEALVSWRHNGEDRTYGKRRGDILAVALPGHPWGKQDTAFHTVVELDDAELEAKLRKRLRPYPVISLPYATFKSNPLDPLGEPVIEKRSEYRLSDADVPASALDPNTRQIRPMRRSDGERFKKSNMIKDRIVIVRGGVPRGNG